MAHFYCSRCARQYKRMESGGISFAGGFRLIWSELYRLLKRMGLKNPEQQSAHGSAHPHPPSGKKGAADMPAPEPFGPCGRPKMLCTRRVSQPRYETGGFTAQASFGQFSALRPHKQQGAFKTLAFGFVYLNNLMIDAPYHIPPTAFPVIKFLCFTISLDQEKYVYTVKAWFDSQKGIIMGFIPCVFSFVYITLWKTRWIMLISGG